MSLLLALIAALGLIATAVARTCREDAEAFALAQEDRSVPWYPIREFPWASP